MASPRFRKPRVPTRRSSVGKSNPNSYTNSSTLLLRPKTAREKFEQNHPPQVKERPKTSSKKADADFNRFMKMRFHAFLAKKHSTNSSQPVDLLEVPSSSSFKLPPRDDMTPLVYLHNVVVKLDSQLLDEPPRVELCEKTLDALEKYLDATRTGSLHTAPTQSIMSYLRRCIYSSNATSSTSGDPEQLAFVPYFQSVFHQREAFEELKKKYNTRTVQNRDLTGKIAELEKRCADLKNKLADQEYEALRKNKKAKRASRDLTVTQASYLGMADEFRKLQTRCSTATSKLKQYQQDYENAVAKIKTLEISNADLKDEVEKLKQKCQERRPIPRSPSRRASFRLASLSRKTSSES